MSEVVRAFVWAEHFEDGFEGVADGVEGARVHSPEEALELREDLLNRIEVGTVGREVQQVHACRLQALANAGHLMCGQIINDDDAARPHFRDQTFLEPLLEDCAGHRAREQLRGENAVMSQTGNEGGCHPMAVWYLGEELLALVAPTMAARHRGVRAGLVDEYQRCKVETGLRRLPEFAGQSDVRPILLSREDRFF